MGIMSKFKVDPVDVDAPVEAVRSTSLTWTLQQQAIFRWMEDATGARQKAHLVVRARAGTSKTTSILEGTRNMQGSILLCAFNKRIADELVTRLTNPRATAKTLHALGFAAIRDRYRGRVKVLNGSERADALSDAAGKLADRDLPRDIRRLVSLLHTKAREMRPIEPTVGVLTDLALQFGYEPDEAYGGRWAVEDVASLALSAMRVAASESSFTGDGIDYADMIYLPLVKDWLTPTYDTVIVDEAQDMVMAQLEMCRAVCRKTMIIVGDDRQAIYGFRGADSSSLDRLKKALNAEELPLTTTFRCGQAIVRRAQRIVPDIEAAPSNGPGRVQLSDMSEMMSDVQPGDFILSRINAPLVSITLALLAQRKRAFMAGRDIGSGIEAVLRSLKLPAGASTDQLMDAVDAWVAKKTTLFASRGLIELADRARDQADMIAALAHSALDADDVVGQVRQLFQDTKASDAIMCSSVHKAKGLETGRVWLLTDTLYRRGVTPEERNIEYVATTRAKHTLMLVGAEE